MIPLLIELAKVLIPLLAKEAPGFIAEVKKVLSVEQPTAADWEALRAYAPRYEELGIEPPEPKG
jgi:hypothetical protein